VHRLSRPRVLLGCLVLALVATTVPLTAASADPTYTGMWTEETPATKPPVRSHAAMVYDTARGEVVMYGGYGPAGNNPQRTDTWVWDGTNWTQRLPATNPGFCPFPAMAYDELRTVTVLFCGYGSGTNAPGETWTWNGVDWTLHPTTTRPSGRQHYFMAYDGGRDLIVLFGGRLNTGGIASDTWTWDGTTWTQVTPTGGISPSARYGGTMAYDASHDQLVLFGGYEAGGTMPVDTWTWDGSAWTPHITAAPPPRWQATMAYDSVNRQTILFGGYGGTGSLGCDCFRDDTWAWDGSTWTEHVSVPKPPARYYAAMAYDGANAEMVLFSGAEPYQPANDTWTYDVFRLITAEVWTPAAATGPSGRFRASSAYDTIRHNAVLVGGRNIGGYLADTWTWNGSGWTQRPASGVPAREAAAMAYHGASGTTVLFGGRNAGGVLGDTWLWNGASWSAAPVGTAPPARYGATMAYDAAHGEILLFGGMNASGTRLSDTWVWTTAGWAPRFPGTTPPAREGAAMAYFADTIQSHVVLFGGQGTLGNLDDTWTWNGTTWTAANPVPHPPTLHLASMAYDSAHHRSVLFGGCTYGAPLECPGARTWAWDGQGWTERMPATSPPARYGATMAYDTRGNVSVVIAGSGCAGVCYLSDTWVYD